MAARPSRPSRNTQPLSTKAKVCEVLQELLPTGNCSVEAVAERFSIDRRSLLRRLRSEGATYSDLLKQVRNELLEHYIENTDLSLTQIAGLLGFTSISALSRWKKSQPRQSQAEAPTAPSETFWMEDDMYFDIIHIPKPTRKSRK
ncbi:MULTISPECIES: helix-turn-helix domain-containing protein [unclassified Caulobacter]|uniref:helix-turn-helix domain-containing protein n=1 Tax=unclassified Caulobacter TaxID=2648921 RepID=UPI001304AFB9|nr:MULTISPECIES: helix-turn-helix domain-containing protein [unclassified Caulobacter]